MAEYGVAADLKGTAWPLGKGVVRRQGKDVALVGYGTSVNDCLAAADMLSERGLSATVTDMRWAFLCMTNQLSILFQLLHLSLDY